MFKKLSLKYKILMMVIPMGLALIGAFAGVILVLSDQPRQMSGLVQVSNTFEDFGRLINHLQMERGQSSQFFLNKITLNELNSYRQKTDTDITEVKKMLTLLPLASDTNKRFVDTFNTISALRKKIDNRGVNIPGIITSFSDLIQIFLEGEGQITKLYYGKGIETRLVNINIVELLKEALGLTRVTYSGVFAADTPLTPSELLRIEEIRAPINIIMNSATLKLIPQVHRRAYEIMASAEWKSLIRDMDLIKIKATKGNYGVDSKMFFNKMTAIIERLNDVLTSERIAIFKMAENEAAKAHRELLIYMFGFGVAILGLLGFAWFTLKDLLAQEQQNNFMVKNLHESEKKAMEASRVKTMFLAIAGHELRTPLNGIIGLSELLRKSNLPGKETNFVDNIYHSGIALLKMINNILEFSKIESGKIELENAEFSLHTLVHQIITTLSVKAHQKNINLNYEIDNEMPKKILGDASRLSQIIYNLVGNAIKFTAIGSVTLKIKIHSIDPVNGIRLRFSIEDTGVGLSEEQQQKLFLPFNVLQSKGTSGEVGSGLGLAISMQLAKAMGGEIQITSEQGKGSCFSFIANFSKFSEEKIGMAEEKQHLQYSKEHREIIPIFNKKNRPTILVVDDNPTNLLMAQAMIERLGGVTIAATNGKEAIYEYSNAKKIDLILMDCQMPIMDGYEATRELRKLYITVPILAMTANTAYEDQKKCYDAGMNGFIAKPISIDRLSSDLIKALTPDENSVSLETLKKLESTIGYQGMAKVVQSYLGELPVTEESIDQLLLQKDLAKLRKVGHHNKSSSQTVGANGLADLFMKLEKAEEIETAAELNKKIHLASAAIKSKLIEHLTHVQ